MQRLRAGAVTARRRRTSVTSLALVAFAGVLFSACTSPKDALGTNASPCFRSLAVARAAVHGHGRFSGVRFLSAKALQADVRREQTAHSVPISAAPTSAVCVVAYNGQFSANQVVRGWSPSAKAGHYALVVVDAHSNVLDRTIVLQHPPLRLARVFPLSH